MTRPALVLVALLAGSLNAQDSRRAASAVAFDGEWSFVRLAYQQGNFSYSCTGGGRRNMNTTDFPDAEYNVRDALDRLTRVNTGTEQFLSPDDPNLMNYPWLYAVEVGYWDLSEADAANLREYLLRGGFLMVDDFHCTDEWRVFTESMRRVFPEKLIDDIPASDPLMHLINEVDMTTPIPADQHANSANPFQCDGIAPIWRGIYDDEGRLMVAISHNMDLGDAWEHANDPRYPEPMSGAALRYAINNVVYSMTH
jgi:hypothetical protein